MFCGVGDYSARLARALREKGVNLHVLTTLKTSNPEDDPDWVHRKAPYWTIRYFPEFKSVLDDFRPDLVHVQFPTQGSAPSSTILLARALRNFKVVSTWHEYPPETLTRAKLYQVVLALVSNAVIVVRPAYESRVVGLLKYALGKTPIRFIPNASVIPTKIFDERERDILRRELVGNNKNLITYFGFIYPHKGVEQIFEMADPSRDHVLLIGHLTDTDPYHVQLRRLASSDRWRGHVTITGFIEQELAARYLAASDAVVFPFITGAGDWNSSLHAAMAQGTFAIATSMTREGYDPVENVYYTAPGKVPQMAAALRKHVGTRIPVADQAIDPWATIAESHLDLYRKCLADS